MNCKKLSNTKISLSWYIYLLPIFHVHLFANYENNLTSSSSLRKRHAPRSRRIARLFDHLGREMKRSLKDSSSKLHLTIALVSRSELDGYVRHTFPIAKFCKNSPFPRKRFHWGRFFRKSYKFGKFRKFMVFVNFYFYFLWERKEWAGPPRVPTIAIAGRFIDRYY